MYMDHHHIATGVDGKTTTDSTNKKNKKISATNGTGKRGREMKERKKKNVAAEKDLARVVIENSCMC